MRAWRRRVVLQRRDPQMSTERNTGGTEEAKKKRTDGGCGTYICVANCTRIRNFRAKWTLPTCSRNRGVRVIATRYTRRIGVCASQRAFQKRGCEIDGRRPSRSADDSDRRGPRTKIQVGPARWAVHAASPTSIDHLLSRVKLILHVMDCARDASR